MKKENSARKCPPQSEGHRGSAISSINRYIPTRMTGKRAHGADKKEEASVGLCVSLSGAQYVEVTQWVLLFHSTGDVLFPFFFQCRASFARYRVLSVGEGSR